MGKTLGNEKMIERRRWSTREREKKKKEEEAFVEDANLWRSLMPLLRAPIER